MARQTKSKRYLKTFFEEKNLPYVRWEIEDTDGVIHLLDNEVVIEHIWTCNDKAMTEIANVIRKIDFADGDVNHFLEHLANAIVANY